MVAVTWAMAMDRRANEHLDDAITLAEHRPGNTERDRPADRDEGRPGNVPDGAPGAPPQDVAIADGRADSAEHVRSATDGDPPGPNTASD
jgi:hypothetical protein